ncbi:fructose bisphosphate aldolase [Herbiconiux sp. KACC 21604]|uniref:fructose bisphosphate aldolase n=1 Tax=unclassified Herbiconiux TaxID=2618217 RepID=UPI001490BC01|nr:fructose bisphosphate aldolase [Herbiconiux sp. SALV-R1]QJU53477.1 fructose bisphosphate aldolase [Herbiconiux sp. SALV-R1]WPO88453.1 fructose bisphosphate aldolase [Herbiconiux sp. KACC 21604]
MTDQTMLTRFETGRGFIAALDQSGGSTPKALQLYGIEPSEYSGDEQMFDLIHAERLRIMTDPAFTSERILAAILFEDTLGREVEGRGVADWLWNTKGIVPFLKIDKGLRDEADGVQLMRDIPELDALLGRAKDAGVLGTKERSVIHAADESGIAQIVAQQFDLAHRVLDAGLLPILEPEVDIHAPDKEAAETLLKATIVEHLAGLGERKVAVKITIPSVDDFYADLIAHPNIARVVALSGGYSRADAVARLARNHGLIASFSRALLDGLSAHQSDADFHTTLDSSITAIYDASLT